MSYLFTSESVSEGHPDKVADQISDALIDNFLAFDQNAKVACETLITTGQVILAGQVNLNVTETCKVMFSSEKISFSLLQPMDPIQLGMPDSGTCRHSTLPSEALSATT